MEQSKALYEVRHQAGQSLAKKLFHSADRAVDALQARDAARIVVAAPVTPPSTCVEFEGSVDEVVCAATPRPFFGVGAWYSDFSQTTDAEVRELVRRANGGPPG